MSLGGGGYVKESKCTCSVVVAFLHLKTTLPAQYNWQLIDIVPVNLKIRIISIDAVTDLDSERTW